MLFRLLFLIALTLAAISPARADSAHRLLAATDAGFDRLVSSAKLPVVITFTAVWSAPARHMIPIVEDLQAEMKGKAQFAVLDVDANPTTAAKLSVTAVPTMMVFNGGNPIAKRQGMTGKDELVEWINVALGGADQKAAQACADYMPQHWLKVGDDWYTRILSSHLHLDYFVEARALKPNVIEMGFGPENHEGLDQRRFVRLFGLVRTTEKGAWSAWKEVKKEDIEPVYHCTVDHQQKDNTWQVTEAGVLQFTARVVTKPVQTDLPQQ
jgi:thioredoxin 1